MQANMEADEDVLFEGMLYRLKVSRNKTLHRLPPERWKSKYIILCRGEKLVLKYFRKKPKIRKISGRHKEVVLYPSFKVEKLSNINGRAFAVQITSPEHQLCLSADEQSTIDIFAFLLQSQVLLRDSIKDGLFSVEPEESEAFRRIGAKGAKYLLHVSPWGLSLVLQRSRCVLAQWPLKSIRFYESSGGGQFTIEAGKVAPMGEGVFVFRTQSGIDSQLYNAVDHFIISTLDRVKPNQRGTAEEIEDYIRERDCLQSVTLLSPSHFARSELKKILQDNWNYILPSAGIDRSGSESTSDDASSLVSQLSPVSISRPPLSRLVSDNSSRPLPSPKDSQTLSFQREEGRPVQKGSGRLAKSSPANRMDSVLESPPQSPEAKDAQYRLSSPEVTLRTRPGEASHPWSERQLSQESTASQSSEDLSPAPFETSNAAAVCERQSQPVVLHGDHAKIEQSVEEWLVSASCEDLSDHMRTVIFQPQVTGPPLRDNSKPVASAADSSSKEISLGGNSSSKITPPPFVNIQQYRSSVEWGKDKVRDRSYSFDAKTKNSVDTSRPATHDGLGHKPSIRQIRKMVAARSVTRENLLKSLSNPSFLNLGSKEQLSQYRIQLTKTSTHNKDTSKLSSQSKKKSRSLASLLPSPLRRYVSKESISRPASSSPSPNLRQHRRDSSAGRSNFQRFDSARSLQEMTIKGIHFTEQSRSFRKPKSSDARGNRDKNDKMVSHAVENPLAQAAALDVTLPQLTSLHSSTEHEQNLSETERPFVTNCDVQQPQSLIDSKVQRQHTREHPVQNGLPRLTGNTLQTYMPSQSIDESF